MRKLLFICFIMAIAMVGCGKKEEQLQKADRDVPGTIDHDIEIEEDIYPDEEDDVEPPIPAEEKENPMTEEEMEDAMNPPVEEETTNMDNEKESDVPFAQISGTGILVWGGVTEESLEIVHFLDEKGYEGSLSYEPLSMEDEGDGLQFSDFAQYYVGKAKTLYYFTSASGEIDIELVYVDGEIFYADSVF